MYNEWRLIKAYSKNWIGSFQNNVDLYYFITKMYVN